MNKPMIAMLLAASMSLTAAAPAVLAAGQPATAIETRSDAEREFAEWKTDTRLGIQREWQLISQSGKSLDEWDKAAAQMKKEGLEKPLTEKAILAADPQAQLKKEDGYIYFIGGNKAFPTVRNDMDAYRMAYSLAELCGGSQKSDLRLWSKLTMNSKTVYSFQQLSGTEEAMGNTLKIVLDEDGKVCAVFSSLSEEADQDAVLITREQAEEKVRDELKKKGLTSQILHEETQRMIHSPMGMAEMLDLEVQEDAAANQAVWVVYSQNETRGADQQENGYPFTAHYVTLDGEYLYSLPVKNTGDEEARNGYRKQDVFAGMSADSCTFEITDHEGEKHTVVIPVMRSNEDGKWYLGDVRRRIAVADYYEAAYGEGHALNVVSSETNKDWDNEDISMYYNYIRAWDFYSDMGWNGPDGEGTDVVILKDMCTRDGVPFENACSLGKIENFQMFGYTGYGASGEPLGLVRGLDVMAHEYTHTFTTTVMNSNLYQNDLGAINEAMSDIMGNLTEYICDATEDSEWTIGENTGSEIRSMSDPQRYFQPSYVWDVYYGPNTVEPNSINDQGGVHTNSSLLSRIAALLCMDHGMSYEEAVSFWTAAAMGMTPCTDYRQIPALLDWALEASGNEKYRDALNSLVEEEHLDRTEIPDRISVENKVVKLKIPENTDFNGENWSLCAFQLDTDKLIALGSAGFEVLCSMFENPDDYPGLASTLQKLADDMKVDSKSLHLDQVNDEDSYVDAVTNLLIESCSRLITQSTTWEANGSGEMTLVQKDAPTLYTLMSIDDAGVQINGMAVLLGSRWYDLAGMFDMLTELFDENGDVIIDKAAELAPYAMNILSDIFCGDDNTRQLPEGTMSEETGEDEEIAEAVLNLFELVNYCFADEGEHSSRENVLTKRADAEYLPTAGLENVQVYETSEIAM